jgi:hypothetical protein
MARSARIVLAGVVTVALVACSSSPGGVPSVGGSPGEPSSDAGTGSSSGSGSSSGGGGLFGDASAATGCSTDAECPAGSRCQVTTSGEVQSGTCAAIPTEAGSHAPGDAAAPVESGAPSMQDAAGPTPVAEAGPVEDACTPVDGGWTAWSWGACQSTGICLATAMVGQRSCTAPAPSCGGAACTGDDTMMQACQGDGFNFAGSPESWCDGALGQTISDCSAVGCSWTGPTQCTIGGSTSSASAWGAMGTCQ